MKSSVGGSPLVRLHRRDREVLEQEILLQRRQIEASCGILDRQPIVPTKIGQPTHCASQALAMWNNLVHGSSLVVRKLKCIDELQ